jgi:hypothetical protein
MEKQQGVKPHERYGYLEVQSTHKSGRYYMAVVNCLPELGGCGNTGVVVNTINLRNGRATSCGCKQVEYRKQMAWRQTTHGLMVSTGAGAAPLKKEYRSWQAIKRNARQKGLEVAPELLESFPRFLEVVGEAPMQSPNVHLVRINKGKGYLPENMQWEIHTPIKKAE